MTNIQKTKQGRKHTSAETLARRDRLWKFALRYGEEALDTEAWAKKEGILQRQIEKDIVWNREHRELYIIDTEKIKFSLHGGLREALTQARVKMLSMEKDTDRREWTRVYLACAERMTGFLEDFGAKPRINDRQPVLLNSTGDEIKPMVVYLKSSHPELLEEYFTYLAGLDKEHPLGD